MEGIVRVGEEFKPHPDFMRLYYSYLILSSLIFYLSWTIPLVIFVYGASETAATNVAIGLFLPFFIIVGFVAFWIPKYYSSIVYVLDESEIVVERGVWWKHKSIVPYNRVTNIDVTQGPLSRRFGLGRVSIQTAGFSSGGSSSGKPAEAVISGVRNFEEIKNHVLARVKRLRPIAVEAEAESPRREDLVSSILDELRKIRGIMEERSK